MRFAALPALVVVLLSTFGAGGCAHALETTREDRVLGASDARRAEPIFEIAEPPRALALELAAARPRLSRTVTLGEGTVEPVYATQAQAAGGTGVVVTNNITVVGAPSVYGGYGYGRDTARSGGGRDGTGGRAGQNGPLHPWAPSGWEGAGRTAAPGDTPHVGGNWAAPPSHGPRQLK